MTAVTERKRPVLVFLGLIAASLGALLLLPPILQDQSYHRFADKPTLLGVQNFWNVVSNFPFIAIGAVGLRQFYRDPATIALFLGLFLTAFGSSYYHWNPNDDTLFWDRLPMTLCFMAILAVVIDERVNVKFVALAASSNGHTESDAVAVDRRSPTLRLGAILSRCRATSAIPGVPAQIFRDVLLARRRVAVRGR
jgi:hypothetical protein